MVAEGVGNIVPTSASLHQPVEELGIFAPALVAATNPEIGAEEIGAVEAAPTESHACTHWKNVAGGDGSRTWAGIVIHE